MSDTARSHTKACLEHRNFHRDHEQDCICTEPAPSAGVEKIQRWNAGLTWINDRAAEPEMFESDIGTHVSFIDHLRVARELLSARARIAALEAGVRKWASECAGCNGTSKKFQYVDEETDTDIYGDCDQCADIRALLPKDYK